MAAVKALIVWKKTAILAAFLTLVSQHVNLLLYCKLLMNLEFYKTIDNTILRSRMLRSVAYGAVFWCYHFFSNNQTTPSLDADLFLAVRMNSPAFTG